MVDMINNAKLESEIEALNRDFIQAQRAEETLGSSQTKQEMVSVVVSNDFRDCRDAAITFHNCDLGNVENLLAIKYEHYVRRLAKYPRMFNEAKSRGWNSQSLVHDIHRILSRPTMAHGTTEEVVREYVERQYAIDAAIIAHLEIRKRKSEVVYRDELMRLVDAYSSRLHKLYYDEMRFGRTDINQFFNEGYVYILLNAPEDDAIDFLDSYLTHALWTYLNLAYGCFGDELEHARNRVDRKMKILNKARQRRLPVKDLLYRPVARS